MNGFDKLADMWSAWVIDEYNKKAYEGIDWRDKDMQAAVSRGLKKDLAAYSASKKQIGGDHYKDFPIQPARFCYVNKLNNLESNIVKYACRHKMKGGIEDVLKVIHYAELLLEWEYDYDGQTAEAEPIQECESHDSESTGDS